MASEVDHSPVVHGDVPRYDGAFCRRAVTLPASLRADGEAAAAALD